MDPRLAARAALRRLWIAAALALAACAPRPDDAATAPAPRLAVELVLESLPARPPDGSRAPPEPPVGEPRHTRFLPSDAAFPNPERGFYRRVRVTGRAGGASSHAATDLGGVRAAGLSLAHSYVRLDAYREQPLPSQLLADLADGLERARAAGIKLILRFAYNHGPIGAPDAPERWVMHHIEQLRPVLQREADVIALLEAGFVGTWGEWHSSTHGLIDDRERWAPATTPIASPARDILAALLGALPATRMVALRYPSLKGRFYGAPLSSDEAFDGSAKARVGHHNDCFASTATDMGTYTPQDVDLWKSYLERDSRWVVMGGEGCFLGADHPDRERVLRSGRSNCATAVAEMRRFHFSYYNGEFPAEFDASACQEEMSRRLGYRFELESAAFPAAARPGESLPVEIRLRNVGWAAPFAPRPVYLVLVGEAGAARVGRLPTEPRRWQPGEPVVLRTLVHLPSDLERGTHRLALWLPDASPRLRLRAEYAVRFANRDVWDEVSGLNQLGPLVVEDDAASHCGPRSAASHQDGMRSPCHRQRVQ